MEYEITHGTMDDVPKLIDIWEQYTDHQRRYDERYDHDSDAADRWVHYYENQLVESKHGTVILAETEDEIIGVAEARVRGGHPIFRLDDHGVITGYFVRPDYRGEGINEEILSAVHDWFKESSRDISFYRANVLADDEYVQELFTDADFVPIEHVYERWVTE